MDYLSDEQLINDYRIQQTAAQKTRVFKLLLSRRRQEKSSWQMVIRKYVSWRLSRSKNSFDVYDKDDLYQRCLCCFYKAVSDKFDLARGVKFSTYMYTALEKTVNRVIVELRKKKRTIEIDGRRISPQRFTDSLQKPIGEDTKTTLSDIVAEPNNDITDDERMLAELIIKKCQHYLTPMQFEIFINGDIRGIISGKELAIKYGKSEPTISAIKKRKITKALRRVRAELVEEFNLVTS